MMRTFYSVVKQKSYISKTGEKLPSVVLQAQLFRNVTLILSCFSLSVHDHFHVQIVSFNRVFQKSKSKGREIIYKKDENLCRVTQTKKFAAASVSSASKRVRTFSKMSNDSFKVEGWEGGLVWRLS